MGIFLVAFGILGFIAACCEEYRHRKEMNRKIKDLREELGYSIR
jgi:hypothetical protein